MSDEPTDEIERVRWWLVLLFILLGGLVIFAAALIAYGHSWLRDDEAPFWAGVLVNIGTSLLLAAALVWFERAIVSRVQKENRQAISKATTLIDERTATRIDRLSQDFAARVEDIDRRLSFQREQIRQQQDEAVAGLTAEISRDGMLSSFKAAHDIGAIASPPRSPASYLIVPAGNGVDAPLIRVKYETSDSIFGGGTETLHFLHVTPEMRLIDVNEHWGGTEWTSDQTPEVLFTSIQRGMVRSGASREATSLNVAAFFVNLRKGLELAIAAREGDEGCSLSGKPVREFIAEDLFVTDDGIEFLDPLYRIEPRRFLHRTDPEFIIFPSRPEGIEEVTWDRAVLRGERHFSVSDSDY